MTDTFRIFRRRNGADAMYRELQAEFDKRDLLPVQIHHICDAISNLGYPDKIEAFPHRMEFDRLLGSRAPWGRTSYQEYRREFSSLGGESITRIFYPENADMMIQRMVCAKELVRICESTAKAAHSPPANEFQEFIDDIRVALSLEFKQETAKAAEDFLTQGKALLILFPRNLREIARQKIQKDDWTIAELERKAKIPAETLMHLLDPRWENVAERLIAGPTIDSIRLVDSATNPVKDERTSSRMLESYISELIREGENDSVEFKSMLFENSDAMGTNINYSYGVAKSIAGFLNSESGGHILVGVSDDGEIVGLENQIHKGEDDLSLKFTNFVERDLGKAFTAYVEPRFVNQDGMRVLAIRCKPGPSEAFLESRRDRYRYPAFYVRAGSSTRELQGRELIDFAKVRFPL